mgnify:CR=1 FL=1
MSKRTLQITLIVSLAVFITTINAHYYTGYTKPLIELSRNICSLNFYLNKIEWYYTDYVVISPSKYVFAAPIGTPLILSIPICLLGGVLDPLFIGGLVMSLSIFTSMIILYKLIREMDQSDDRYILTSIILSIYASLPWIYSSHIFPQALLTLFFTGSLYTSIKIIKQVNHEVSYKYVILNAVFSGLMFLTDPSTIILVISYTIYLLILMILDPEKNLVNKTIYILKRSFIWLLVFVLFILFQLYYDYITTGNPFLPPELLYSNSRGLGTGFTLNPLDIMYAIYTQLIDPRKSLMALYPLSLFSLIYLVTFPEMFPRRIWLAIIIYVFAPLITYSAWHDYHGGLAYGPRFLTPITAILSIPLVYIFRTSTARLHLIMILLASYSIIENNIVLITNVYPCAIQDLAPLENQFFKCSINNLLKGTRSSFIYDIYAFYLRFSDPLSTILSILTDLSLVYLILIMNYLRRK